MSSLKRQKDKTLKDELPRSVGAQHATGDQWKIAQDRMKIQSQSKNNTQFLMCLVQCYKEQCCIGTWNIRFMNHGKLEGLKQKARVNMDILGINELK